jgi:hypothetical protein
VGRRIVADLARDGVTVAAGRGLYHEGDSFTGSQLHTVGWKALFPETPLKTGDLVLRRWVVMPRWCAHATMGRWRPVREFIYPTKNPLKLMDNAGSAGFYASVWGALPFTFSTGPWERYVLFEVSAEDKSPTERG